MGIATTRTAPRNVSLPLLVSLSLVMLFFAVGLYVVYPVTAKVAVKDKAVLTGFREPETGEPFVAHRLEVAPVLYGLLHAVPAMIWSVGMPIQHSASLRRRYPALHRWSGRAAFLSGLTLNVTGLTLIAMKLSYSGPFWELHKWGPLRWPSFSLSTSIMGFIWPIFAFQAYRTARAKRWAEHRRSATIYTICGYWIMLQRVSVIILKVIGRMLSIFPKFAQDLGLPGIGMEGFKVERAAFAFLNIVAYALAFVWYRWIFQSDSKRASSTKKVL